MKLLDHYLKVDSDTFRLEQIITISIPLEVDPQQTTSEFEAKLTTDFCGLFSRVKGMAQRIKNE